MACHSCLSISYKQFIFLNNQCVTTQNEVSIQFCIRISTARLWRCYSGWATGNESGLSYNSPRYYWLKVDIIYPLGKIPGICDLISLNNPDNIYFSITSHNNAHTQKRTTAIVDWSSYQLCKIKKICTYRCYTVCLWVLLIALRPWLTRHWGRDRCGRIGLKTLVMRIDLR